MYRSIVVGTDGSTSAAGAVGVAAGLARAFAAQLHVVCVHDAAPMATAMVSMPGVGSSVAALDAAGREHAEHVLADAQASLAADGVDATVHACTGSPGEQLVEVAERVGADLVVVGNRGMHGMRRILGSVPNHVTHHAPCAVLIVPTAGASR